MRNMHRGRDTARSGRLATNAGITTVELMIAGFISAVVLVAAFTMYLTSMETWDVSGARLALQRDGDRAVKQIASDIRHGDMVSVPGDSTSIIITRTVAGVTSTLQTYALSGDEVVNQFGTVVTGNVTNLKFDTGNNVKVRISMTLADDMGTSALPEDDQRVEINSLAVCRNEPS